MKKTTYLFIAGIALLFAYGIGTCYRGLQKVKQEAAQIEKTLTRTPFQLRGKVLETQYYSLFTEQYKIHYERVVDCATIVEFPHSIVRFSRDGGPNLCLLNDGTAMTYDCDRKALVEGSKHNLQLAALQDSLNALRGWREVADPTTWSGGEEETALAMNDSSYRSSLLAFRTEQAKALEWMGTFNREHRNDWAPAALLVNAWPYFNYEEMMQVVDTTATYWQHPELEKVRQTLRQLAQLKAGTPMTDVPVFTPDGEVHRLKEWTDKGGYTLVTINQSGFSSLTHGLLELAYSRYHNSRGLEIVEIGAYNDYRYWKQGLDRHPRPWVSTSTLGGSYPLEQAYTSAPFFILFGPEAEIVIAHPTVAPLLEWLEEHS